MLFKDLQKGSVQSKINVKYNVGILSLTVSAGSVRNFAVEKRGFNYQPFYF